MHRHALILDEPGSEISLKSQSSVAVNGLSMGPNKTLVGKHSLKTAEKRFCESVDKAKFYGHVLCKTIYM